MIEFESAGKTFRDGTAAVLDLTLQVPVGRTTVIVGASAGGATTALRMVNRLVEPSQGRLSWDGTPLRSRRKTTLRRQMGYLTGSGGLFPHRTVLDNIGTVPGLLGWSRSKTERHSLELLDRVGLDRSLAKRYPDQLTAGQPQRVGLARALAADPPVVLMEQPFHAADPMVRRDLQTSLVDLQRQLGKTIILVTDDVDEALLLGDQVAVLRADGRLAQVGSPEELLEHPADAFVEGLLGRDRGFRSLSYLPAGGLSLSGVKVVRDVGSATSGEPTLVVDQDARPLGWVDGSRPDVMIPLGATFDVEHGSVRSALDAALTSPFGLAVAITASSGRYAGVATAAALLAQVAARSERSRESIAVAPPSEPAAPLPDLPTPTAGGAHRLDAESGALDVEEVADRGQGHRHERAELGDEGGQDVEPAALAPEDSSSDLGDQEGRPDAAEDDRGRLRELEAADARR